MTLLSQKVPRVDLLEDVARDLENGIAEPQSGSDPSVMAELGEVVSIIRHYVIPRLEDRTAPFNVVFAGPTGSGKSTLINSVVGRRVSRSGTIRPTTKRPLVYTHTSNPSPRALGSVDVDVASGDARILRFISLVDTPDIDSTSTANHKAARDVIAGADLVVFVASALRYADLIPWSMLRTVRERRIPVIPVLNRVSPEAAGSSIDFRRLLRNEGMDSDVIVVAEHRIDADGSLPRPAVAELRSKILDTIGAIDRGASLDAAMTAVRADLAAAAYELNSAFLGGEQAVATWAVEPDRDLAAVVEGWRSTLADARSRWRRLFRPGTARALGEHVADDLRTEVTLQIEKAVRLGGGRLVVDLTGGDVELQLPGVDPGIDEWFESLGLGDGAESARLGAFLDSVRRGVDEFAASVGLDGDRLEPSSLDRLLAGVAQDGATAPVGQSLLDLVQRSRARMRAEEGA